MLVQIVDVTNKVEESPHCVIKITLTINVRHETFYGKSAKVHSKQVTKLATDKI